MRIGDLIEWEKKRWIVRALERSTRTVIISDSDARSEVIPDDLDKRKPEECALIANPADDWPLVAVVMKPKFGRLLKLVHPVMGREPRQLVPFEDWVVADAAQTGGAIFFNPILGLRLGDILVATYERGTSRVTIPREFLSTREKITRANTPAEPPKVSVYDRLRRNVYRDDD